MGGGGVLNPLGLAWLLADPCARIRESRARSPVPRFPACPRAHASTGAPSSPRPRVFRSSVQNGGSWLREPEGGRELETRPRSSEKTGPAALPCPERGPGL